MGSKHRLSHLLLAAVMLTAMATSARAQSPQAGMTPDPGEPAKSRPGLLGKIRIDQRLNEQVPLDIPFTDESGREIRLRELFGTRPVILALVYYECPMLCTQVLNGLVSALGVMNFEPGREFDVIAVSFNPREGPGLAAQKKANYLERYGRPHTAAGWHFLTGKEESIKRLTDAIGFRYEFDPEIQQYAHGAGIEVLTPKGAISKYFYGIEFSARDIRLGLIEAAEDRIGTPIDDVLLFCYHYDPATGKYGAAVLRMVRVGGVAFLLALASFITVSLRREARSSRPFDGAQGRPESPEGRTKPSREPRAPSPGS
jgi:protein SCO1